MVGPVAVTGCAAQPECAIRGTPGKDVIRGTAGRDVICAGVGNEIVY